MPWNAQTSHPPPQISTGQDPRQHLPDSTISSDSSSTNSVTGDTEKDAGLHQRQPLPDNKDVNNDLVEFDGPDDPGNPKAWSRLRRWAISISLAMMVFVVTFSSSIFSVAIQPVSKEYHCSTVVSTLGVSLFLLGFVLGPICFGPASEVFGRKWPLFTGYLAFAIFQIPVAVAQNLQTIMLGRFLGGFAAAAPLSIMGGVLADIWDPVTRAYAVCVFAFGGFAGPVAGPIVGGFVAESSLGWRWTAWITLILASFFGAIGLFLVPETSAQKILQARARELRFQTRNWALHAKADEHRIDARSILTVYLLRPFVMIVQEPILALMTAYLSFLYGIVYLLFEAYPITFQEARGWSPGIGALPFIPFIVGTLLGCGLIAFSTATNFKKSLEKHGKVLPEQRLPPMIVGAIVLPIGLFWFAWTSDPHITWVPQVIASGVLGFGLVVPFWQGVNYIIDCYGFYSNSAISVNTFIRSIAGAAFPLFAPAMYHNLGVAWATSLLGFFCVAFAPAPIFFYIYGERIRRKSRFTPTA